MRKRAIITTEDKLIKVFIPSERDPEKKIPTFLSNKDLIEFLKEKNIGHVSLCSFYPELISLKIPLPFTGKNVRNKKIIEGFLKSELSKRYSSDTKIAYYHEVIEKNERAWIRLYVISEKDLELINSLILQKTEIEGNYPLFILIRSYLEAVQKIDNSCQIFCLFAEKFRYLFIFDGSEMIFQRSYESGEKSISDEDVININMTLSYAIQNLRVNPEKIVFIGAKESDITDISIPMEFLPFEIKSINEALKIFEKQLRGKELLTGEYKSFKKSKKALSYASFFILLLTFLFAFNTATVILDISKKSWEKNILKSHSSYDKEKFLSLKKAIDEFKMNSLPLLQLYNEKNSTPEIKAIINTVAEASNINYLQINSIEIENAKPQKIKISGNIKGKNFSENQMIYNNFVDRLEGKGLRVSLSKWELAKGEYSIETINEK